MCEPGLNADFTKSTVNRYLGNSEEIQCILGNRWYKEIIVNL